MAKIKRICEICKSDFEVWPSHIKYNAVRFCSKACQVIGQTGEKHPRFTQREDRLCQQCNCMFELAPYQLRKEGSGKYCSRLCSDTSQRVIKVERVVRQCKQCGSEFSFRAKQGVADNRKIFCSRACMYISRRVPKIKLICKVCSGEFEVFPSSIKYNAAKFCSKKCGYVYNSGENHFRYIGASSENEKLRKSPAYKNWRASVFVRDNRQCVWCESKKDIEADHIKPFSLFPEFSLELSNGRTLCHECHSKTDSYMNSHMKREDYI